MPLARAAFAAWLILCAAGSLALARYQSAPGPAAAARSWPAGSALPRASVVLFAHPRCPCTAATVDSLAWLMARAPGATAVAVFYRPERETEGWQGTSSWRAAAAIPGVTVVADPGGVEAARFGALTSGQAFVFAPGGARLYAGGLTAGRAQYGSNAGRDSALAALSGRAAPERPVFGCALAASAEPLPGGRSGG